MATLQRATYTGKEEIMDAYRAVIKSHPDGFLYSVWVSQKEIAFQCIDKDSAKAEQLLEGFLDSLDRAENDDLFILRFHPIDTKGFVDRSSKIVSAVPVRVCEVGEAKAMTGTESGRYSTGSEMDYRMKKALELMEAMPGAIDKKIDDALQARIGDVEPYEPEAVPDPVERILGYINAVAANPAIMSGIGQILNFLKPGIVPAPRINGMSDTEKQTAPGDQMEIPGTEQTGIDEVMLNDAIGRLHAHCRVDKDLSLLADLAEQNPMMFNMLLGQLRSKK